MNYSPPRRRPMRLSGSSAHSGDHRGNRQCFRAFLTYRVPAAVSYHKPERDR